MLATYLQRQALWVCIPQFMIMTVIFAKECDSHTRQKNSGGLAR
ncbi:hypothetical protein yrohd0001_20150 [Yersinia rohdei ATCC 43380]|nr:hypothetical protein yrohd0001_20150 [Yersinia rohdei ATCC 43380]